MKILIQTFILVNSLSSFADIDSIGHLRYTCEFGGDVEKGEVYINRTDIVGLASCMEMGLGQYNNLCWRFQRHDHGLALVLRSKHSIYQADNYHHNNDPISGSYKKIFYEPEEISTSMMFIYDEVTRSTNSSRVKIKPLMCKFSSIEWSN